MAFAAFPESSENSSTRIPLSQYDSPGVADYPIPPLVDVPMVTTRYRAAGFVNQSLEHPLIVRCSVFNDNPARPLLRHVQLAYGDFRKL